MAVTVEEASAPYANFMLNPVVHGDGICTAGCCGMPTPGYSVCHGCASNPAYVDVVVPITYSVHLEQMHTALRGYKEPEYPLATRQQFRTGLAAVLWRFLDAHEPCVASAAGVEEFNCVVTVPSNSAARDDRAGGLRTIVGETIGHTRERYVRALVPTGQGSAGRAFDPNRFRATQQLDGADVLLIDDTWTTGSKAQSAAYILKQGGAGTVACVVIGRHVHRDFGETDAILRALPPFDWDVCAVAP